MDDDRLRWDRRYRQVLDDGAPDATNATPAAPDVLGWFPDLDDHLPATGRALDVACGPGPVTLWLAARGLDVVALDVSPVAIDMLREAARADGLHDRIDARVTDLDLGLPDDLHDLDLIVCQRFRDPALYPVLLDRTRPGAVVIVTVLSEVGADDPGPFHAPACELFDAFTNHRCEVLHHRERDGLASIVIRRR